MLIHGRLILTSSGIMLDEVKSLLQKSLRRKDKRLVSQSAKELLLNGKDQLPWKSIYTFLFEDHCLTHVKILEALNECVMNKNKLHAVQLLLDSPTCRVAACLPVVAMDDSYIPKDLGAGVECENSESGLVATKPGSLDFDKILANLKAAWLQRDIEKLMFWMKLCSMVEEVEKRKLTRKGESYLLAETKNPNIGHLVTSLLHKHSKDDYWRRYTKAVFKLLSIKDCCVRLGMYAVLAHVQFFDAVKNNGPRDRIDWVSVGPIDHMPDWAVDKHTYRGKFGKGTEHLLKTSKNKVCKVSLEEFHGQRPKQDIKDFFEQGVLCQNESLGPEGNPYWKQTIETYYKQPPKLQKTAKMTEVYYKKLKTEFEGIFCESNSMDKSDDLVKIKKGGKRKLQESEETMVNKKARLDTSGEHLSFTEAADNVKTALKGPLLQLPTGSGKVYTCAVLPKGEVWKGPYRDFRLNLTLFFHRAMRDVFNDVHTMEVRDLRPFLVFPLFKGSGETTRIIRRDYYDCIRKLQITDGEFVERGDLGLVQLHRIKPHQVKQLPTTIWLHFMYRYLLNVGDSGLYNAIADVSLTEIYGIDLEESRSGVKGTRHVDLMFTKLPAKAILTEICHVLKERRQEISTRLEMIENKMADDLEALAKQLNVSRNFDRTLFEARLQNAKTSLA